MDGIRLSVLERTEKGDGPSRRLRLTGQVPGVVYGKGIESTAVSVSLDSLRAAMSGGPNVVMELDFGTAAPKGAEARYAVVKELQFHPTKRSLLHIDLYEVDLKQEIEALVPLELVGTPAGVADEGIVDWVLREVTVRALPTDIPALIELDVTELELGQNLTVEALKPPADVVIVDDPEAMVVAVVAPRVEEEEVEAEELEEGEEAVDAEGEAAAAEDEAEE